jgi:HD-like signal output (HDOD) protein
MSRTKEIAVLPQVVYKIMEMTSSTDSSAALLEKAIVIDPGFSAKILTQANSAYYALPRKVTSIREAVAFLGFRAVRQLAMAVGVFDLFVGKTDRESLRRRAWWRHSLDTAVCCKFISGKLGLRLGDEAYTVGLLHYIGKTLMDRSNPTEYEKVMLLTEKGATDLQAERAVFGCDHIEVGIAAAVQWGFPEVLVKGMDYLNRPEEASEHGTIAALVNLGDKIARAAVNGKDSGDADIEAGANWSTEFLGVGADQLKQIMDESTEAIAAAAVISF